MRLSGTRAGLETIKPLPTSKVELVAIGASGLEANFAAGGSIGANVSVPNRVTNLVTNLGGW